MAKRNSHSIDNRIEYQLKKLIHENPVNSKQINTMNKYWESKKRIKK